MWLRTRAYRHCGSQATAGTFSRITSCGCWGMFDPCTFVILLDVYAAGVGAGMCPCYWTWVPRVCASALWRNVFWFDPKSTILVLCVSLDVLALVGFALWAIVVYWLHVVPSTRESIACVSGTMFPFACMASWASKSARWWSRWYVRVVGRCANCWKHRCVVLSCFHFMLEIFYTIDNSFTQLPRINLELFQCIASGMCVVVLSIARESAHGFDQRLTV